MKCKAKPGNKYNGYLTIKTFLEKVKAATFKIMMNKSVTLISIRPILEMRLRIDEVAGEEAEKRLHNG